MNVLILGGGFTGAAVATLALARGLPVAATTCSEARAASLRALGVIPMVASQLDADAVAARLDARTRVLVTMPPDGRIDAALTPLFARTRVGAIAYVSSTGVYGDASGHVDDQSRTARDSPRAASRLDAEDAWRSVGATIVRAPAIYGPGRGLHLRLARGEARGAAPGTNAISRVHVEDLAAALVAVLTAGAPRELYVMGDLEPAPHADVLRWICGALAITPPPHDAEQSPVETLSHDRRADSTRIRGRFDLTLRYPSYREGYAQCIARDRTALDEALAARARERA